MQTPQGAAVLIYAHESGITLVWRGGRRLKTPGHSGNQSKQNGTSSADALMIIDSDDEASPPGGTTDSDKPEFEEVAARDNASFPDVVQTLDLSLGTAALHIAVLPMVPSTPDVAAESSSPFLKDRMVFAVSCATGEIYLVTIPLTPPSHQLKTKVMLKNDLLATQAGRGTWGETLTCLGGQSRHSDGLALSLVAPQKPASEKSRSRESSIAQYDSSTRVVVASHTREASGTLRLWDVNLLSRPGNKARLDPFQTEYLPTPLTGISFNPSQPTQLLAITSPHAVRLYDYSVPSLPEDVSEGPFPSQGSWLLSLYAPFARGSVMCTARKPIVAADWIAHGRAVLTLLADGQWGIWDIDGAHPPSGGAGAGGPGLFGKHSPGLRGAALTTFSATGYLEGTSPLRNPVSHKLPSVPGPASEFVPMTPHTRRDAQAAAMGGGVEKLAAVKGGVAVLRAQPLRATAAAAGTDESAVLWIGGADPIVAVIPAVSRFWDAQLRRGAGGGVNLFSGAQPTRMVRLADLGAGLLGERCMGVEAVARAGPQQRDSNTSGAIDGTPNSTGGLPIDVIVQGESRLVVVRETEDGTPGANRLLGLHKKKRVADRSASAIIAYPRPEKPSSVAFNLSVSRAGNLGRPTRQRPPVKGLFGQSAADKLLPSTEVDEDMDPARRRPAVGARDAGLAFAQSMALAADASDNEREAEERNVEEEMLDIMEIDRELEEMERERDSGRKHVFFEEG